MYYDVSPCSSSMFTLLRWCEDCVEGWRRMCREAFPSALDSKLAETLHPLYFLSRFLLSVKSTWLQLPSLTNSRGRTTSTRKKRRISRVFCQWKFQLNKSQHIFFHKLMALSIIFYSPLMSLTMSSACLNNSCTIKMYYHHSMHSGKDESGKKTKTKTRSNTTHKKV